MAIQIKDALKTVGGISTSGAITTTGNGNHNIGSTSNRFNTIIGTNIHVYDANAQHYASLRTTTVGTADTQGVGRLVAGNNVNAGTAGNSKGQIILYGTNTGYTLLTPGYNNTSSVTATLPSASGTLPIMTKGDTSYWGMLAPDGGTSWIRTTTSGLIPSDQNKTSALGTSSWPFGNIYGTTIYEDGTSLTNKYAAKSHGTHLTIGTGASNAAAGNHTHSYLPLSGGTMTGAIKSSSMATTWVNAAKGNAIINSTLSPGSFSPIASAGTTNGRMTLAWYNAELNVAYLTKANCDASTNTVTHLGTLMNESGGAYWPGTVEGNVVKGKTLEAERANFAGNGPQLMIKSTNTSNNYATIQFINSSGASMGFLGMSAVNGGLYRWKSDASVARAIIDEDTWSWALPSPTSGAYWQGLMKVNNDGVMEAGKYLDFHNTGNTSNDYDVRLQSNGANRNVVYLPTGSGDLTIMQHANSYWGIMTPGGNNTDWIRTTQNGLIPYQSGGHGSIGTDTWPFSTVYANTLVSKGAMSIQGIPLSIQSGAPGVGGVWIQI